MSTQAGSEAASATGTHEFRAEARQLLDIVIHSLYSNREIFLFRRTDPDGWKISRYMFNKPE